MDDLAPAVRAIVSCGIILATLGALGWAAGRVRGGAAAVPRGMRSWRPRWFEAASRRANGRIPARRLEVLDRLALAPDTRLALVRCDERRLLLAFGNGATLLVASFADAGGTAERQPEAGLGDAASDPPDPAPVGLDRR